MNGHEFVWYFLVLTTKKISMLKIIYHQYGVLSITFLLITYENVIKCLDSNLLKSTHSHWGRIKYVNITCEPERLPDVLCTFNLRPVSTGDSVKKW